MVRGHMIIIYAFYQTKEKRQKFKEIEGAIYI